MASIRYCKSSTQSEVIYHFTRKFHLVNNNNIFHYVPLSPGANRLAGHQVTTRVYKKFRKWQR